MTWDEGPDVGGSHGPYFQSQRFDRHKAVAEALVASGHAYYDFTPPEKYDEARKAAEARGEVWRYVRSEWVRPAAEARELASNGTPRAIRFKVPEGHTAFTDLVKGVIEFDNTSIDDFVIVRRDGLPIYHLSVVCDDVDMAITHVIRGDDHVSNTPKHVLLFTAMGAAVPAFAHVPMILGPDKKRLSKRHGATSVLEYKAQGYLPEAMLNFLALLGWSPGDDSELHSVDDLTARFALDGIGSASAVFNTEKLDWMNSQHIMRMDTRELATRVEPFLSAAGMWDPAYAGDRKDWFCAVLELFKPRAKRLTEFVDRGRPFFAEVMEYDAAAQKKLWAAPETPDLLIALADRLTDLDPFDPPTIEPVVRALADERAVKATVVMQAVRLAVSGSSASPGLFEMMALVGRDTVLARLRRAAEHLAA